MAYNGWTKHLGQTSSWHLICITVGSNPVWREREMKGSTSTVMYLSSRFTVVYNIHLLLQVEYHKSKSVLVAGRQLSYGLQCGSQSFLLISSLCRREKGHNTRQHDTTNNWSRYAGLTQPVLYCKVRQDLIWFKYWPAACMKALCMRNVSRGSRRLRRKTLMTPHSTLMSSTFSRPGLPFTRRSRSFASLISLSELRVGQSKS